MPPSNTASALQVPFISISTSHYRESQISESHLQMASRQRNSATMNFNLKFKLGYPLHVATKSDPNATAPRPVSQALDSEANATPAAATTTQTRTESTAQTLDIEDTLLPSAPTPTIRPATLEDLPYLLHSLLTSFIPVSPLQRRLYSPLTTPPETPSPNPTANFHFAKDTLTFWRKQLLADLAAPHVLVLIAELPEAQIEMFSRKRGGRSSMFPGELECWKWADWCENDGGGSVKDPVAKSGAGGNLKLRVGKWSFDLGDRRVGETQPVGWGVWRTRGPTQRMRGRDVVFSKGEGWSGIARSSLANVKTSAFNAFFLRRDQDPNAVKAYYNQRTILEKSYPISYFFLNTIVVDFRLQRKGIGTALLKAGMQKAEDLELTVIAEVGKEVVGWFERSGWHAAAKWTVDFEQGKKKDKGKALRVADSSDSEGEVGEQPVPKDNKLELVVVGWDFEGKFEDSDME